MSGRALVHDPRLVPAFAAGAALLGVLAVRAPLQTAALAFGLAATMLALRRFEVAVALFTVLTFLKGSPVFGASRVLDLATASLVLSWLLLLAGRRVRPELLREHPLLATLAVVLGGWAAASALWAADDGAALSSAYRLVQMLVLFVLVYAAVADASSLWLLARAFVAGAVLTSLLALIGLGGTVDNNAAGRFGGYLGNPNNLAAVVVPALVLACFMLLASRRAGERALLAAAALFLLVVLVMTGSRGGLVGFAAAGVAALALAGPARRRVVVLLLGVAAVAAAFFVGFANAPVRSHATTFSAADSTGRIDLWHIATQMAANHPVQGVGLGNFTVVEPSYLPAQLDIGRADLVLRGTLIHNTYLNVLTELGIVGAVVFVALVAGALGVALAAIRRLAEGDDRDTELLARGLAIGAVGMLAAYVFFSAQYEKQLWIVLGALVALSSVARARRRPDGGAAREALGSLSS